MQGSVPIQGPEEGRGAPPGEEQRLCRGGCPGQGRRSRHTLPAHSWQHRGRGEQGAPSTGHCPREGGNHQWDLLPQAKAEAVPIQAQG